MAGHARQRTRASLDVFYMLALLLSIAVHSVFVYTSSYWEVAKPGQLEEDIETMFKVKIQQLESRNFASRPTSMQLKEEREKVLQQEIQRMADVSHESVDNQLTAMTPDIEPVPLPEWEDRERNDLFVDDQPAQDLITTDEGERSVKDFEDTIGKDSVRDEVAHERIPLTGRGFGTQKRIMASLPEPKTQSDAVVSRSLATLVRMDDLAPAAPDMEVAEPPIELPPVSELLPSPNLLRAKPAPVTLQKEEEAKEELKKRFVQLDDLLDVRMFTYHHIGGDGYFRLQIRPKSEDDRRLRILPKDILLAMDVSASMGRLRTRVLKEQLVNILGRLRPRDRFNIIGFRDEVERFTNTLAPVNEETLEGAEKFIGLLEASGKTDIYTSLQPLVQLGTARARPLILLLFSDGRPTVGVVSSRQIINNLSRFLGPSTSIFCVGTGGELNRYLLDMLAFRNRGLVAFEQDREQLPMVVQSVFGYIEDPVLLRIRADFDHINEATIYPKTLPDLYLRGELNIWGRLEQEEKVVLRLVGEAYDELKEMIVELPVPEIDNGTYEIARNWAYHKAYHIVGQMVAEGEKPDLLNEIRHISRTYNIVTPYSQHLEN